MTFLGRATFHLACILVAVPAFAQVVSLSQLAPAPPAGMTRVQTNPIVVGITNATEVFATDYRDVASGTIRAGILLARTSGDRPYEHNRKTCRLVADAAILDAVVATEVDGREFYSVSTSRQGEVEQSIQLIIRILPGNYFVVDSRYLSEEYGPLPQAIETVSVQIWAADILDTVKLAKRLLSTLRGLGTVTFQNAQTLLLPKVAMVKGTHFGGILALSLLSLADQDTLVEFDIFKTVEVGSAPVRVSFTAKVSPGTNSLTRDLGPMSSLVIYSKDDGGFRDQIFVGRGFGYFTDVDAGGGSRVTFDNRNCLGPRSGGQAGAFLVMPGCAGLTGTVDRWAGMYLPVGSVVGESVNLVAQGYVGVRFKARATRSFRFQVEDTHVQDFDFHGVELTGDGTWREYTVLFKDLRQRGFGKSMPISGEIRNLSWLIDPPDGANLSFGIAVDEVYIILSGRSTHLIFDFGDGSGIWMYRWGVSWRQLHPITPEDIITGDLDGNGVDDIVVDFGSRYGVWVYFNGAYWLQLHVLSPSHMVSGDFDNNGRDDLVLDFPAFGVWVWYNNTTWGQLHVLNSLRFVVGNVDGTLGDDLIIEFSGWGIWSFRNNAVWGQIHPYPAQTIAVGDVDGNGRHDIIIAFQGPFGTWSYRNNLAWSQVHALPATVIAADDMDGNGQDELVLSFPGAGVWVLTNGSTWWQLHPLAPEELLLVDVDHNGKADVVADFGAQFGIWAFVNSTTWVHVHPWSPEISTSGNLVP